MSVEREREEAMMRELLRFAIEPPAPGLADRVLAAVAERSDGMERHREPRSNRIFGLVAVLLAGALVVTLLYAARIARQPAAPASHGPAPMSAPGVVPIRGTAVRPFLTSAAGGWLAEQAGGRTTLYQSSDGGASWTARLRYVGGLPSQVIVGPDGAGLVVGGQPVEAAADPLLFRTSDGGASWQRLAAPVQAQAWGLPYFTDASQGWVLASLGPGSAEIVSTTTSDAGGTRALCSRRNSTSTSSPSKRTSSPASRCRRIGPCPRRTQSQATTKTNRSPSATGYSGFEPNARAAT